MADQANQGASECEQKLAAITAHQGEFDQLWLKMSQGDTSGAARYRELRHILDGLRAEYSTTCGELKESSSLPAHVLADWRG